MTNNPELIPGIDYFRRNDALRQLRMGIGTEAILQSWVGTDLGQRQSVSRVLIRELRGVIAVGGEINDIEPHNLINPFELAPYGGKGVRSGFLDALVTYADPNTDEQFTVQRRIWIDGALSKDTADDLMSNAAHYSDPDINPVVVDIEYNGAGYLGQGV